MQIIVAGCEKTGALIANTLSKENNDVVVIDQDYENFINLDDSFDGLKLEGVPIDFDILEEAGIETCDAFIAVTSNENLNLMSCEIAKSMFGVERVIALVGNRGGEEAFKDIELVCHTELVFDSIRSSLSSVGHVALNTFINGYEFEFFNIEVDEDDDGKLIGDIEIKENINIFGILRSGAFLYAPPNLKLQIKDVLIVSECLNYESKRQGGIRT